MKLILKSIELEIRDFFIINLRLLQQAISLKSARSQSKINSFYFVLQLKKKNIQ